MKQLLAAYGQRILFTLVLSVFGGYLLVAVLTYTPFDPGWTHLSSDTQQVSNASGVAGAWIADLLYGFLGKAAVLVPVLLLLEAVYNWWPHGFVARPFRVIGLALSTVCVATLCSLHSYEPTDTLANAAGGIVGYELAWRLLALMPLLLVTLLMVALLGLFVTLSLGIHWHRTFELVGQFPGWFRALFASAGPAAAQASTPVVAVTPPVGPAAEPQAPGAQPLATTVPEAEMPLPEVAPEPIHRMAAVLPVPAEAPEAVAHPEHVVLAPDQISDPAILDKWVSQREEQGSARIEPSFDWQDPQVIERLLKPAAPVPQDDPFGAMLDQVGHALTAPAPEPVPAPLRPAPILATAHSVSVEHTESLPPLQAPIPADPWPQAAAGEAEAVDTRQAEDDALAPAVTTPVEAADEPAGDAGIGPDLAQTADWAEPEPVPVAENPPNPVPLPIEAAEPASPTAEPAGLRIQPPPPAAEWEAGEDSADQTAPVQSIALQAALHRASLPPLPGFELLDVPPEDRKPSYTPAELQRLSELLEIKLQEFNIKARVIEAQPGPVVTRFELELAPGVKASKVTNISRDLARSLSMASVRVVEVIPGKPYIGIEVPNSSREMVRLIELLRVPAYRDPAGLLTMAMGKDIAGRPVLTDLAKAPHMLVAGTTGSGKSVAVNAMLLSLLLKYTPEQLRLILIDPKQLELANYGDIPHLLTPVVTDMKDAVSALNWCVGEMERRYKLMTLFKVRKIDEFNRKVSEAAERGEDLIDPLWKPDEHVSDRAPRLRPLPLIVIVADEFADMIMQVGKKAEELITRLAQKSRAAGIHLMLATQRPSVDVITGLIKANIPTRVALRVNSKIDSRTILDAGGAEDMLGHGDMLFLGPGKIEPERVHGAFISDDEVNRICDAWRERGSPDYVDDILTPYDEEAPSKGGGYDSEGGGDSERDPMYDQVVAFVLETRKVSASSIQRKFSLGFNRASRIVDAMEEAGIISPMDARGKRDILV